VTNPLGISARRIKQAETIPKDWLLSKPPLDQNVLDVPESSGLLSSRELEITGVIDIELLLSNLANGIWSSVEVTTAFYKRAIIGHQLVCHILSQVLWKRLIDFLFRQIVSLRSLSRAPLRELKK
jgi:amidase